jgi:FkbM family methyltransferase
MELDLQDWIPQEIYLTGTFEPGCSNLLRAVLKPGDLFVDVGANIGYFTLLCSRLVGIGGRVLAVEPNPEIRAQLQRNLSRNGMRNVQVFDCALSEAEGEIPLFLGPPDNTGLSSFRAPRDSTGSIKVRTAQFDALFPPEQSRAAIVKINVEGAELRVLRGMRKYLARNRPDLIIELSPEYLQALEASVVELYDLLAGEGYRGYDIGLHELEALDRDELESLGQFNAFFTARPLARGLHYGALSRRGASARSASESIGA